MGFDSKDDLAKLLDGPAELMAPRLLGSQFVRELDGQTLVGTIVETEAYDQTDAASHSYRGQTPRTEVMFGPAGFLYVYFTYGMHYCCNIVVGPAGHGSAVLIRAIEPVQGEDIMAERRHSSGFNLTNGPAKLCQALEIDRQLNGHNLRQSPLKLVLKPALDNGQIVQTSRIGISRAQDAPLRYFVKANPWVSR